jgi:hypothetical protein
LGVSGTPGLVSYKGLFDTTTTVPGSIDLGQFIVSPSAATTAATYTKDPFEIIVTSSGSEGAKVSGVLDGAFGPSISHPSLTATITGISQYGASNLPFGMTLPIGTPLTLAMTNGTDPAPTELIGATSLAVPEPSSIAVLTFAIGGLGLWHRQRLRAGR